jgi:hydroxyethylthiazole kinase-like uncharacterized protein yjeF
MSDSSGSFGGAPLATWHSGPADLSIDPPKALAAGHRRGVWPVVSAAEMRELDQKTIDEFGVPGEILMESAGRALVGPVLSMRRESDRPQGPVRVFCGAGNNGGDGFVVVRHLWAEGVEAVAILLGDPARLPVDAAANWARLAALGPAHQIDLENQEGGDWDALLADSSVVVDALFGTGLARPIEGPIARLIEAINRAQSRGTPVLSVDIPSGIAADTGAILGSAVRADRTVTISLPKIGLVLEPGASHAGQVLVARVGITDPDPGRLPRAEVWNARSVAARLPTRERAGHKGTFGHVLVVSGSSGKTGAAALCARGAARAGAGLVTLAYPRGLESELVALPAEVMTSPVAATAEGCFARAGKKAIEELVASRDVVVLGPGIGVDPETIDLVRCLVATIDRALVVDADGLNALRGELARLHDRSIPAVLTPHPGEAARLLETTAKEVNADRVGAARNLARASRSIVVLKGARTVVADPEGRTLLLANGGPILATGGTGDVLAGMVAALLAAGLEPFEAAGLAAWWHADAGDRMDGAELGFGMLAHELADGIPAAAKRILEERGETDGDGRLDLQFPGP